MLHYLRLKCVSAKQKMNIEGKEKSQKESTKPSLSTAIENAVESLMKNRGGPRFGITVKQLAEHLSTTSEVWSEDQIVDEVKKMVKKKRLAIGKCTTERGFKKIQIPYLNRLIRPSNPNRRGRPKKTSR